MRLLTAALSATVALGLLTGCSGSSLSTPNTSAPAEGKGNHLVNGRFIPGWSKFASLIPAELQRTPRAVLDRIMPDKHEKKGLVGVYASTFYNSFINGYKGTDRKNAPPICTLGSSYVNDIAVDGKGNLMIPDEGVRVVDIYGPDCGAEIGVLDENSYYLAQPSDAASLDVTTGTIIVGNIFGLGNTSNIAICTLKDQCTGDLTNDYAMYELAGVALAKNGDCWGSASDRSGFATMTYFKHCAGSAQTATGWKNTYYGGLDIDTHGKIVAVDAFAPQLWIYRGCNPACHVVAGPFPLHGTTVFGHLNGTGTQWVGADFENGMLDVYKYSTKALKYEYSISNGLSAGDDVEGAAFAPASKE